MATNGALSDRILCNRLASRWSGYLCHVLKPPSSEKSIQKSPKTYMLLYTMVTQYSVNINAGTVIST